MVDNKVGYMDKTGSMNIKPQFESGSIFVDGLAPVKVNGKLGCIDKKGKLVIEARFEWDQRAIDQYTHYNTHFKPASPMNK